MGGSREELILPRYDFSPSVYPSLFSTPVEKTICERDDDIPTYSIYKILFFQSPFG
jgi:hypothetical protein